MILIFLFLFLINLNYVSCQERYKRSYSYFPHSSSSSSLKSSPSSSSSLESKKLISTRGYKLSQNSSEIEWNRLVSGEYFRNTKKITVTRQDLNRRHLGQLIGNETLKILFCPIEKVMSTQFKQLFDRIAGDNIWFELPYHKLRYHIMINKTKEEVMEIFNDPTWIKAVIFRDPAKRLLSSYLHLIKSPNAIKRYKTHLQQRNKSTTWSDFRQSVLFDGMKNVHWDPQTNFCGLKKFWPFFNFVGNFELIREHGPILSKVANLDSYTQLGWARTRIFKHPIARNKKNRTMEILNAPIPSDYNVNDCMWCQNRAQHKSDYISNPIEEYLAYDIWNEIRTNSFYKFDYEIFSKIKSQPFNFTIYDKHFSMKL